jgi:hypothetical protein
MSRASCIGLLIKKRRSWSGLGFWEYRTIHHSGCIMRHAKGLGKGILKSSVFFIACLVIFERVMMQLCHVKYSLFMKLAFWDLYRKLLVVNIYNKGTAAFRISLCHSFNFYYIC